MSDEIDYRVLEATLEALGPIIRAHGVGQDEIAQYVFYLLLICGTFAEEIGMSKEQFRALADSAYRSNKKIDSN